MNPLDVPEEFWSPRSFDPTKHSEQVTFMYQKILPYFTDFLASAHEYREGMVCPFASAALKGDRVFFTMGPTDDTDEGHVRHIAHCVDFHLSRKTARPGLGATVIIFPEEYDIERLLRIHYANTAQCIERVVMLGVLYSTSMAHSLHSHEYFPNRTPLPVLVIRDMVPHDFIALDPRDYSLKKRIVFLEAFIERFGNTKNAEEEIKVAHELIRSHRRSLVRRRIGCAVLAALSLLFGGYLFF